MGKADKRARKRENQQKAKVVREAAAKRTKRNRQIKIIAGGIVVVFGVVALASFLGKDNDKKTATTTTAAPIVTTTVAGPITTTIPSKGQVATIQTNFGTIKVKLNPEKSPIATKHFTDLVNQKFYDGLTWHRVVKDFMIQGGDAQGNGQGIPKKTVVGEVPTNNYPVGTIAGAKLGSDPAGTFGDQFFIVTGSQGATLPNDYASWGTVIDGIEVAKKIEALAPTDGSDTPTKEAKIVKITLAAS